MIARKTLTMAALALLVLPWSSARAGVGVAVGFGGPHYYRPYYGYRVYVPPPRAAIYIGPGPTYVVPAAPAYYYQPVPPGYVVPVPVPVSTATPIPAPQQPFVPPAGPQ